MSLEIRSETCHICRLKRLLRAECHLRLGVRILAKRYVVERFVHWVTWIRTGFPLKEMQSGKLYLGGVSTQEIAAEGATVDSASNSAFKKADQIFSFRAAFSGFICSLVDSAPSEIAVVSLKNFNALARWNALRTTDASVILSVGWLQVDNHVPSAPFPVAVRPDSRSRDLSREEDSSTSADQDGLGSPLLVVGLSFAPKHQSGIVVS